LSGQLEVGLEDGSKKILGFEGARLADNLTDKEHASIVIGNKPRITVTIVLKS
jgi:hypothetical protein